MKTQTQNKLNCSVDELIKKLPHGNGINADWQVVADTPHAVALSNTYFYMNEVGYYDGCLDFWLIIPKNNVMDFSLLPMNYHEHEHEIIEYLDDLLADALAEL